MRFMYIIYSCILFLIVACSHVPRSSFDNLGIEIPKEWSMPIHEKSDDNKDWIIAFKDEDLIAYIGKVRSSSPDFLSLLENEKIGRYNASMKGADILPKVNLGFNQSESRQNLSAFGFADSFLGSQGSDSASQNNSGSNVVSFKNKTFGFGLTYQWEIDIWGRLLNERIAAKKDYEALKYDLSYIGFSLVVRSAILFYQGVEALQQSLLSEESYESLVEIRNLVKHRYEKGLRSSLDFRLAETSVSTAILEMENRKNQLVVLNRQLEALIGEYPSGTFLKQKKLPKYLPEIPESIPASIVERRPDIRSLVLKVESNINRVAQAKRNLLPGLSLKDYGIWNLGLNVTAPIFNGSRLRSAIKIQKANFENSKHDLVKGLLNAFSEIEQLMYFDQSLKVQTNALSSGVEQSKDAYKLSKERYDKGVTTLESVLSSQRQYNTIKSQHLRLQRQSIENRLLLILALGGDFDYKIEGSN